jgi:hypothetical protein
MSVLADLTAARERHREDLARKLDRIEPALADLRDEIAVLVAAERQQHDHQQDTGQSTPAKEPEWRQHADGHRHHGPRPVGQGGRGNRHDGA